MEKVEQKIIKIKINCLNCVWILEPFYESFIINEEFENFYLFKNLYCYIEQCEYDANCTDFKLETTVYLYFDKLYIFDYEIIFYFLPFYFKMINACIKSMHNFLIKEREENYEICKKTGYWIEKKKFKKRKFFIKKNYNNSINKKETLKKKKFFNLITFYWIVFWKIKILFIFSKYIFWLIILFIIFIILVFWLLFFI